MRELSAEQLRNFRARGFLLLERILPQELADVLRLEALSVTYEGSTPWREFNQCLADISHEQRLALALIQPFADQLLPQDSRLRGVQFAYNGINNPDELYFHVDGAGSLAAGSRLTELPGYMLGCGIVLADLSQEFRGNLIVKPGGHFHVQDFFRSTDDAEFSRAAQPDTGDAGIRYWVDSEKGYIPGLIPGISITASPGDIYFFHGMLPHAIGPNTYADRPAIYLRFGMYSPTGLDALRNMWRGWYSEVPS